MARLVQHDAQGPFILKKEELKNTVAVCGCGLSDRLPMCDGSHKTTQNEEDGKLYRYKGDDARQERIEVEDGA